MRGQHGIDLPRLRLSLDSVGPLSTPVPTSIAGHKQASLGRLGRVGRAVVQGQGGAEVRRQMTPSTPPLLLTSFSSSAAPPCQPSQAPVQSMNLAGALRRYPGLASIHLLCSCFSPGMRLTLRCSTGFNSQFQGKQRDILPPSSSCNIPTYLHPFLQPIGSLNPPTSVRSARPGGRKAVPPSFVFGDCSPFSVIIRGTSLAAGE